MRYHGAKWRIAPWIISLLPPHNVYVEPFGGSAAVLMRKDRSSSEIYNERSAEIVNVFRVLREPSTARHLARLLDLTPFSRVDYEESMLPAADPVEQARRTIFRSFAGFGSAAATPGYNTGFRAATLDGRVSPAKDWANYPPCIEQFTNRLRGVIIENRCAFDVIRQYAQTENAVFYIDPPYVHSTRSSNLHTYAQEMTDADHVALTDLLGTLEGAVLLSGYDTHLYDSLGWTRIEREALADGGRADGARPRLEVLWLNDAAMRWQRQPDMFQVAGDAL